MDQTFLLMLSNLLHLHTHLDPTTSPLSDSHSSAAASSSSSSYTSSTSPSALLSSSSAAPLLFFTISSVLSFLVSQTQNPTPSKQKNQQRQEAKHPPPPPSSSSADDPYSVASFRALSTERIWVMEAPLRDAHWRSLYGLSYPVFTTVVEKLKPHIALYNLSLPSDYAVAMVLSRLAHGSSASTLASLYSLDPYLVSKITNMVTRLLSTKLYPEFIKIPVGRRRLHDITHCFDLLTSLPNVCGAVDSSRVALSAARRRGLHNDASLSSLLLQVVSDHRKIFWDVCVKAPGATPDAAHFRDSLLYHRLTNGDIVWDKVINVAGHGVQPYIVGDWGYPLLSFLLTPFSASNEGNARSTARSSFDSALMKARSSVVEAIGLLKGRWRILQDLNVGINHAPQTIVACCVLHNLCQIAREPEPELWKEPEESCPPARVLESEKSSYYIGESFRQAIADDLHQRLSSR